MRTHPALIHTRKQTEDGKNMIKNTTEMSLQGTGIGNA